MSWAARKSLYAATALVMGALGITGIVTEDQAALLNNQIPEILILVAGLVSALAATKTGKESDAPRAIPEPEENTSARPRRRSGLPVRLLPSSAPRD